MNGGVFISADPLVAHLAVTAAGAVRPREVSGLADQLAAGLAGAPQLGAGLHVGAGLGAGPEGELTLALEIVVGTRKVV